MTIASALDQLNDKLAGSDQQASQTIEGMIYRIIDNIDQGGGSLPVASADTLGGVKVGGGLTITEGGVLSATGGGGGGGLVVHPNLETGALDKTWAEITSAADSGYVALSFVDSGITYFYPLEEYLVSEGEYIVSFSGAGNAVADSESGYPLLGGGGDIG